MIASASPKSACAWRDRGAVARTSRAADRLTNGPEVIKYQDQVFLIIVSIQDPVPLKLRKMFDIGPLERRLYCLEIWEAGYNKVLNLIWNSIGATPEIICLKRGHWEQLDHTAAAAMWTTA
jgi:hypothetical protein